MACHVILCGVFLKAKLYTLVIEPDADQQKYEQSKKSELKLKDNGLHHLVKGKGVEKKILNKTTLDSFLSVLLNDRVVTGECHKLTKKNSEVYLSHRQRQTLTSYDDKRVLFSCGIHSFPYGSKVDNNFFICDCRMSQ